MSQHARNSTPGAASANRDAAHGAGARAHSANRDAARAGAASPDLNAARRADDLAALRDGEPLDVLVVGGGVTGAGTALDAAARGLRVGLIERRDFAWGTSRWSSKLVHGGLRYLAQGAFGIAMESARERDVLLRHTAPHLVHPVRQVIALTPDVDRAAELRTFVGVRLGDVLRRAAGTPATDLPRARRVTADDVLVLTPGVRRTGLRGGIVAWDAQLEDDARLVVGLARTAAAHGAHVATRCAALEVTGEGARVQDELTGETFDIRAKSVVTCTGVWASELSPELKLRPSRGTHLVVDAARIGSPQGIFSVPIPGMPNRFVFAIPQPSGLAYIGLTDEEAPGPVPDVPEAPESDIRFLLATMSAALERPLGAEDILGTYAGLRPLADGGDDTGGQTSDLSRRHVVARTESGAVSVVGGKLTTYRRMAQDAVDAAIAAAGLPPRPCPTRRVPLVGAASRGSLAIIDAPRRVVDRHGAEAPRVLALADGDPSLLEPIAPGLDVLGVEVLHAVRAEGALDAADVLDRRTRIGLVPADRERALPAVEALVRETRHPVAT